MAKLKEVAYLEAVILPLVTDPKTLKIEHQKDDMGILLTIDTNAADSAVLIGKSGETAKCIRRLLHIFGSNHKARYNLKINSHKGE